MDDTQSILQQLQLMQRDTEQQISSVRKEMHDMGMKFDRAINSHNELRLEFSVSMERIKASVELIDKNQNEIWADLHKLENSMVLVQSTIKRDEGKAEAMKEGKKSTINWVQWITPILISLLGAYLAIKP